MLSALWLGIFTVGAHAADEPKTEFTVSGFATLAGGKVLGGTHDPSVNQGFDCPCFISDYAQAGVYDSRRLSFQPDSKLGLQARLASPDQRYSVTAQAVARSANGGRLGLEWLYATAELDGRWTLQAGRKRLPLFQYSDVQDIGHALPWIHLPPQLYGWEVVNYNGVNLSFKDSVGPWTISANAFAGSETVSDSGYWKIYNGKTSSTSSKWNNILGTELKISRGNLDVRGIYMQSNTQNRIDGVQADFSKPALQRIYGIGITADFGKAFVSAEFLKIDRKADYGGDAAQLLSVGYRMGKFTPLLSYSNYRQSMNDPAAVPEAHRSVSAVLRYDYNSTTALKVQYDHWKDKTGAGFESMHGDARILSFSVDKVF